MRTHAQTPKGSRPTPAITPALPRRKHLRQCHQVSDILSALRATSSEALQHLFKEQPVKPDAAARMPHATRHGGWDVAGERSHSQAPFSSVQAAGVLHRHAAGAGPLIAPEIVHEVLRGQGQPIPAEVRQDMEARLGHDFTDVRVHTGKRAAASADAVAADAYTVGRQIVFAQGRFDPVSRQGRQLIAHELSHAAAHPVGVPAPSGALRVSTPTEAAERHATRASQAPPGPSPAPDTAAPSALFRQVAALVGLTGVSVNHARVTVPPAAGLTFTASKRPANASGVTISIVGDNAAIATGTTVDSTTGVITVSAAQTGGSAHIEASQNATGPGGATLTSTTPATAPFNFNAIPSGITRTSASTGATPGFYGGDFTHTFTSPAGGQGALERSHVNERFAAARGSRLDLSGTLGRIRIRVNNPNSASAGWDLDASGTMVAPDHVTWSDSTDARPFVTNASNPSPSDSLPQALTATQDFRNLSFPALTYGATAVASTTHRRAIEERSNRLKAVTSANASGINQEIVEDYAGPTLFRRCRATPAAIRMSLPTPPGGSPPAVDTTTITVDTEGQPATPTFSIRSPDLGCTITPGGVLTPGTTAGTVTVRAGDAANFDEIDVVINPRPATFIRLTSASSAADIIRDNSLAERGIDAAALARLNPEIQFNGAVAAGTVIWFRAREVAAAATGFEEIAERHFGNRLAWPTLWSFNPDIHDPASIEPTTRIHLQSEADQTRFGEVPLNQD
ncbi:eCIS core domain-containing protein [Marinobacterium rhizophilum]|uniref:DUF4157 domain-containing protein n=1 Tax=Marinobacterium rhizophilum TaxID=420402 RepID=A0ABY5HLF2_9GAMM|nr:DUF4157 domain-containing protein [Marinobacterium rhizophilum]UTW12065.1 DUF4157 domain-containing protein [Marinobacterium rhizophilum]